MPHSGYSSYTPDSTAYDAEEEFNEVRGRILAEILPQNGVGAELGVFKGQFTPHLYGNEAEQAPPDRSLVLPIRRVGVGHGGPQHCHCRAKRAEAVALRDRTERSSRSHRR